MVANETCKWALGAVVLAALAGCGGGSSGGSSTGGASTSSSTSTPAASTPGASTPTVSTPATTTPAAAPQTGGALTGIYTGTDLWTFGAMAGAGSSSSSNPCVVAIWQDTQNDLTIAWSDGDGNMVQTGALQGTVNGSSFTFQGTLGNYGAVGGWSEPVTATGTVNGATLSGTITATPPAQPSASSPTPYTIEFSVNLAGNAPDPSVALAFAVTKGAETGTYKSGLIDSGIAVGQFYFDPATTDVMVNWSFSDTHGASGTYSIFKATVSGGNVTLSGSLSLPATSNSMTPGNPAMTGSGTITTTSAGTTAITGTMNTAELSDAFDWTQ